jgi:hypothetical protein
VSQATLKSFFCTDEEGRVLGVCDAEAVKTALGEALKGVPKAALKSLGQAIDNAMDEVFAVPLGDILASSWEKLDHLKDAFAKTRADPEAVVFAPLMEHAITSKHTPSIDLVVGGKTLGKLELDISLALNLKGVQLEVRRGRICGLKSGDCEGEGAFSCGGQPLIKKATPPFALAGKVDFGGANRA